MRVQALNKTKNFDTKAAVPLVKTPLQRFPPELLAQIPKTKSGYQPKFPLRDFQNKAINHIEAGRSALVSAPTGSGKRVIAVAAMYRAIKQGKKLIYTAPIKALSNQKISEFKEELARQFLNDAELKLTEEEALEKAKHAVGLSTGDHSDKPEAPIQVMTTEVLNLLLYSNLQGKKTNKALQGLSTIVFDEFHYLNDPDRGHVWEEAIINAPQDAQIIGLSATMGNPEQIRAWINSIKRTKVALINEPEKNRPVKLKYFHINKQVTDLTDFSAHALSGKDTLKISDRGSFGAGSSELRLAREELEQELNSPEDKDLEKIRKLKIQVRKEEFLVQMLGLVKLLQDNDKLPAIVFKFNKEFCDLAAQKLADAQGSNFQLLSEEEKLEAESIIKRAKVESPHLANEAKAINELLKKGIAPHHAGHLPQFKTLVEKLFEKGLIKVVFATSTLAAGINMPARTTVLTELESGGGGPLSISEFKQMAGRAGRPGHDTEGNVFVFEDPGKENEIQKKIDAKAENIKSRLKNKFTSLLSFIQAKDPNALNQFISQSFLHYQEKHPVNDAGSKGAEEITSDKLITGYNRMTRYLQEKGFIDIKGELTDKGRIASCFKFNNPLFITEILLELSNNQEIQNELKEIRIDNFIALISLLGSDEGQIDLERLNAKLAEFSDKGPRIVNAMAIAMQDSLNGLAQAGINAEAPALNYSQFWTNQNWASSQENIRVAKSRNQVHSDEKKLFKDIVKPKAPKPGEENNTDDSKPDNPGTSLRSIKQTLNLLKHMSNAVEIRTKDDPRKKILSPELASLVKNSARLINKDIVADNKFDLSI